MTKGPISTAKRAPATTGAASRAARADGRAAGVGGSRAISGARVTLGSSREAGAAAPGVSSELSGAPVFSAGLDRKSTRLNSSHDQISYAVFCLKKKKRE